MTDITLEPDDTPTQVIDFIFQFPDNKEKSKEKESRIDPDVAKLINNSRILRRKVEKNYREMIEGREEDEEESEEEEEEVAIKKRNEVKKRKQAQQENKVSESEEVGESDLSLIHI